MAPDAIGTSSPEYSGGDDARALYDELTDDLLYDPAIGRATMMGYPCVRLAGKVFREWVAIPTADRALWHAVLAEAVDFARTGLGA